MPSREENLELLQSLEAFHTRYKYNRADFFFPETGPLNRAMYPKHMGFVKAGQTIKERLLLGANRSGKSILAAWEVGYHLTGLYPKDWAGKKFNHPVNSICLGVTHDATRNVAQALLCGDYYDPGTGMIPRDCIDFSKIKPRNGIPNAYSQIAVKHHTNGIFDGYSICEFNSYVAGADVLQGTTKHITWEDEENPDPEIHSELVTRTATVDGTSLITFTPRNGWSQIVLSFLPDKRFPKDNITRVKTSYGEVERYVTVIGWEDAPHLTQDAKAKLLASYQPWEIECRSKGIPSAGTGKVFTTLEDDFVVKPFKIPPYWPRAYGMDVGWNRTACAFVAYDEENDVHYLYHEYYGSQQLPLVHAHNIKQHAKDWMLGAIDKAAGGSNQRDGQNLLDEYRSLGLNVRPAPNNVEAGIIRLAHLISTGRFRVFSSCTNWLTEYRFYARDDEGRIKKQSDHVIDATRYLMMIFYSIMRLPIETEEERRKSMVYLLASQSKNPITGY